MRQPLIGAVALLVIFGATATAQEMSARLDSAMRGAERNGFSGVVRVERGGTTLLEKGYGKANRAAQIPFSASTIVQIGSNTKDFTAVAILQLVEAEKIRLTDSLGKYVARAPADKRNITIAQLLNHRAGFPLGIGGDFDVMSCAQLVDSAMRTTLLFTPGARESYSNTGFSILAAIIEQVTGTTYDVYVRDAILAPLGLHRTGFLLPGFSVSELAHGYLPSGTDQGTMLAKPHATDGPYWNLRGNGGMLSTVADMHAFYNALLTSNKLLRPATRALRFHPDEPIGLAGSDGVNFFLYDRFPMMGVEIIIASTNAAMKAPLIRRELGRLLGLPDPDGGDTELAQRPGGKTAQAPIATVIAGLVTSINAQDMAALRTFIAAHFASDAGAPSLEDRVQRIGGMHDGLGTLAVERVDVFDDGTVEARLTSALQGTVVLLANMDNTAPYLIHGLRVRVGG